MKIYRYMGLNEFQKMCSGVEIVGPRFHRGCATTSTGVCFLPEVVRESDEWWLSDPLTFTPLEAYMFLFGVVEANPILVEFEVLDPSCLKKSMGIYACPEQYCRSDNPYDRYYERIAVDELCIPSYSRETFHPLRYAMVGGGTYYEIQGDVVWYPCNLV